MRLLRNDDVSQVLDMRATIEALRSGYSDLAEGNAAYVPRIDVYAPTDGEADYYCWGSMTGVCRTYGIVATRMKSDVLAWGDTREKYCIEPGTYSGIILLYAIRNGEPLGIVQDGYLQHMRVGGSAGLGADLLARKDATRVGLLGSGGMARTYLQALGLVRGLKHGKVYSPTPAHRVAFASEMADELGFALEPVNNPEDAVQDVDIVVTATDSMGPTFDPAWLAPGTHVTCVTRRELGPGLIRRADVIVQLGVNTIPYGTPVPGMEWTAGGIASYVIGSPDERARIPRSRAPEVGAYPSMLGVTSGDAQGRISDEQVSLFINTGTQGLQFASVAGLAFRLAAERGLGQEFPTEWWLQDVRD